jgi:hypothetical protein
MYVVRYMMVSARPGAHEQFKSLQISCCSNETQGCIWKRTHGDCLIRAMKKLQLVLFQGLHNCHFTPACTNETHRNKWMYAHRRVSPTHLVKPAPSKAISLWSRDPNTNNLFLLLCLKRCMIMKY